MEHVLNSSLHDHNTRTSTDIHLYRYSLNVRAASIKIHGAKIWNTIDSACKILPSAKIFKRKLKLNLLNKYT